MKDWSPRLCLALPHCSSVTSSWPLTCRVQIRPSSLPDITHAPWQISHVSPTACRPKTHISSLEILQRCDKMRRHCWMDLKRAEGKLAKAPQTGSRSRRLGMFQRPGWQRSEAKKQRLERDLPCYPVWLKCIRLIGFQSEMQDTFRVSRPTQKLYIRLSVAPKKNIRNILIGKFINTQWF